jgi:hypothetical protein
MFIDFENVFARLSQLNRRMVVEVSQCNFDNWNFQYNQETPIDIIVPDNETKDLGVSVYTKLLKKFEQEGYKDSYERVYKEFYRYRHSLFWNTVNYLYWDYGYSFSRIILWTLILIIGLCFANLRFWEQILQTYILDDTSIPLVLISPMEESNIKRYLNSNELKISLWNFFYIFVFTCMIIFSFRVSRSKFRFENRIGLCLYLSQFLFGIATVYFLLNVAIKTIA